MDIDINLNDEESVSPRTKANQDVIQLGRVYLIICRTKIVLKLIMKTINKINITIKIKIMMQKDKKLNSKNKNQQDVVDFSNYNFMNNFFKPLKDKLFKELN